MEENTSMAENLGGAETIPTDTPSVDQQTVEDSFLAGFSDEDTADGQTTDDSNSKGELNGDNQTTNSKNQEGETGAVRPDKRSRANERIQEVLAERNQLAARLKELERQEFERSKPSLQLDEDGNVSIEAMNDHQEKLIQYEINRRSAETMQQIQEAQRGVQLESAISDLQVNASKIIQENSFLNEKSPDFDAEASEIIFGSVLDKVKQLQVSGVDDFQALKEVALEELDRQVQLVKIAEKRAQATGVRNYQRMQDGAALTNGNSGRASGSTDPFLSEFLSD